MATQNQYTSEPETPVSPLGVRSFRTIERLTKHLLAERGEGRSLHENYRIRRQAPKCTRNAAWNSGLCRQASPTHFEVSVQFVVFVQYDLYVPDPFVASLYLSVKYPFEL